MRTLYFGLTTEEILELDKEQIDDEVEENLQQLVWTQDHTEIIEIENLDGKIAISKQ